ncbi:hypothetical protein, partial [uncultured Muribaculum sp.]|uniref:hypothetical protein n=1 Tax=uncultured Muribaculum sp. TaxID=1918613 RepID=UPI00260C52FA
PRGLHPTGLSLCAAAGKWWWRVASRKPATGEFKKLAVINSIPCIFSIPFYLIGRGADGSPANRDMRDGAFCRSLLSLSLNV